MQAAPVKKAPVKTPGKLMRLRCRLRPLFEGYLVNDKISDKDSDVTFECLGGQARGHKIILSIVSKFFCQIFADQKPYKPTTVYVPDVPVSIMKLILKLCYKDNIRLSMKTMKDLGNYLSMFGLGWDLFNFTEAEEEVKVTTRIIPASQVANRPATPKQMPTSSLQANKPVVIHSTNSVAYGVGGKVTAASPIVVTPSTVLKTPQTFVLDTKTVNGVGSTETSNSNDYKFKVQNYKIVMQKEVAKAHNQPRLILPKPANMGHPATPAKIKLAPPVLTRMPDVTSSGHEALASQIEVELDDNQDNDAPADAPEAEQLFHEWAASVGKVSTSPPRLVTPSPIKRKAVPMVAASAKSGQSKASKRQCSVCNWVFDEDSKWRWHEERHVGINLFKCTLCERLFSTARQVYQHEMMEHGIIGTPDGESHKADKKPETHGFIGHMPVGDDRQRVMVKTQYGTHYRRVVSSAKKASPDKKYKGNYANLHFNFHSRNSQIGICEQEGQQLIDSRKLKQLHWLYVCSKCENCSDSSAKAISHHKICYSGQDIKFEETVVKFRQGFYGKCKCPLCPRRYTSLAGFLIHCGHMHQDYRRVFSHINSEDKMMCVNCREKFADPSVFHTHLNDDLQCSRPPKEDVENQDGAGGSGDSRQRQFTKLIGKNPRSARLQNRLAAVTACFEDDPIDEESFAEVSCPICGEASITNLTVHISSAHQELDIQVERIEESTLRCKACGITFALCDLLTHNNSCTGSKGLNYLAQRKTSQLHTPAKAVAKPKINYEYPPGIGTSLVDKVDKTDLLSIDVLREALTCGVCKRVGKKMNVIAECLRSHGVYRCAICFNSYLTKEQNSMHLKKCHANNSGRVICPICRIVRSNAGQLTSHMYMTHWLPVMQENAVDIRASKLMNQMQENDSSVTETDKDETLNSTTVSTAESGATADSELSTSNLEQSMDTTAPEAAQVEGQIETETTVDEARSPSVAETNEGLLDSSAE